MNCTCVGQRFISVNNNLCLDCGKPISTPTCTCEKYAGGPVIGETYYCKDCGKPRASASTPTERSMEERLSRLMDNYEICCGGDFGPHNHPKEDDIRAFVAQEKERSVQATVDYIEKAIDSAGGIGGMTHLRAILEAARAPKP